MNIGLFTDTYYPQINGVVTSARVLEKELNKLGHKVYIFTTTDPNDKHARPRVFRLPSMPLIFLKTHRLTFFYPPRMIMRVKRFKLDIVHTYTEFPLGFFGKLISQIYRIPMVHTYHTMYEDYVHYVANGHLITPKGAQRYSRMFCNRARVVVAPAEKTRQYLKKIGVKRPVRMIPTGLDFAPFDPKNFPHESLSETRQALGLASGDRVVVTVGRVAKEKSIDILIDMMPKLLEKVPNVKLLIVGDGPHRELLAAQTKIRRVEHAVIFAGYKPWDEIGKYYRLSDAFATASTSETQGLTYIEAMAARIPVVVRRDPSFESLIRHGETGFLFDDADEAAEQMAHVLCDSGVAARVVEKGYEAIQELSAEAFGKRVEEMYRELLR